MSVWEWKIAKVRKKIKKIQQKKLRVQEKHRRKCAAMDAFKIDPEMEMAAHAFVDEISASDDRQRKIAYMREQTKTRIKENREKRQLGKPASDPPVYDDVFYEGLAALNDESDDFFVNELPDYTLLCKWLRDQRYDPVISDNQMQILLHVPNCYLLSESEKLTEIMISNNKLTNDLDVWVEYCPFDRKGFIVIEQRGMVFRVVPDILLKDNL